MSRLDDMEARIAALEAGGAITQRVASIEEVLGLGGLAPPAANSKACTRCGMTVSLTEFRCAQEKCPIKAAL